MVNKTRGFEFVSEHIERIENLKNAFREKQTVTNSEAVKNRLEVLESVKLPSRSTSKSAGYDFMANEHTTIPSIWKQGFKYMFNKLFSGGKEVEEKMFKPTLVSTGVKSYMGEDEALLLYNRSSNPLKKFLLLANGTGVIDGDYYNNPDNEGHIMFQFINFGIFDQTIKPGDKIGQGIFQPFLKADGDSADGERTGGFGSTGE